MSAPVLEARSVSRRFPGEAGADEVWALRDVSLNVRAGEFVVVRGRSGSGKSTLLNLFGLLDRPTDGDILFLGEPTRRLSTPRLNRLRRRVLGYLFQDGGLIERMSVLDNVCLPLRYGGMNARLAARQAMEALEMTGIADKAARRVGQLSGGERLRVGLARAVAGRPAILICDEPTASLDAENAELITGLLKTAARSGAAVVTASHDPVVIARAGRLISLERGRVMEGELVS